jgi:DNA-binding FadR family transcriptional regulator
MAYMPSKRRNLPIAIAEDIALKIMSGQFPPGALLPNEHEWMRLFDVSRPALREAIRLLGAKGLVFSRPRLGTVVRDRTDWTTLDSDMLRWMQIGMPRREFVSHVMAMRIIIEPPAAALAAIHALSEEKSRLAILARRIDADDETPDEALAADVAFHRLILTASRNPLLAGLGACIEEALRATIAFTRPANEAKLQNRYWRTAMQQHKEVAAAIEARDSAAARAVMQSLLDTTDAHLRSIFEADAAMEKSAISSSPQ